MNYIKKSSLLAITLFSLIGNEIFAAGAKVYNGTSAVILFQLFTTKETESRVILPNKTEDIDAGFLVGINGAQWLYCGKMYRVNLSQRIEGIEGWRNWNITSDAKQVTISGNIFGTINASLSAEGNCPCDLGQTLRAAMQGQ